MDKAKTASRLRGWKWVLLAAGILLAIVIVLFIPWNTGKIASNPRPVQNYAEAVQRI
jgi:uncharacterized integral membrane protein